MKNLHPVTMIQFLTSTLREESMRALKLFTVLCCAVLVIATTACSEGETTPYFQNNVGTTDPTGGGDNPFDGLPDIGDPSVIENPVALIAEAFNPGSFNLTVTGTDYMAFADRMETLRTTPALQPAIDEVLYKMDDIANDGTYAVSGRGIYGLMGALKNIMGYLMNQDTYDNGGYSYGSGTSTDDLYAYLLDLHNANLGIKDDALTIGFKTLKYINDTYGSTDSNSNGVLDTNDIMNDLNSLLSDSSGQTASSLLINMQEGLGKLLVRAEDTIRWDDPYNYDGTGVNNIGLGNAVYGVDLILNAVNNMVSSNNTYVDGLGNHDVDGVRADLYGILREAGKLQNASGFADKTKQLLCNIEDYYTVGGASFGADYYHALSGSPAYYVNAELRNAVKELWPGLAKLFIREHNPATAPDYAIFHETYGSRTRSPIEWLTRALYQLKTSGIDYSAAGNELEPSLKKMVQYNAYGTLRSGAFQVSSFDHMLFTISTGYNFGYLTNVLSGGSTNGEPYSNSPIGANGSAYQHGNPTRGILTLNDTMYPLTSSGLNTVATLYILGINSGQVINVWSDTYTLVLGQRYQGNEGGPSGTHTGQGKYVWRSNSTFTPTGGGSSQTGDDAYEFFMGYDYPAQLLLGPCAIGDAGLPNGGRKAITPTSNATTATVQGGTEQVNDYRTYWPKAADGKGMLNTGAWMFNWISRACWDGQGPYYYAPSKKTGNSNDDPDDSFTFPASWPGGSGAKPVKVYYKPNGEVYAYVYKPTSATWQYYYPASTTTLIGNDVVDPDASAYGQRFNRYRYIYKSDYYAVQRGHEHGETTMVCSTVSNTNGLAFAMPPMNPSGSSYAASTNTSSPARYDLNSMAAGTAAQQFWAYEKVQEWTNVDVIVDNDAAYKIIGNASRECASQEEAMFRNYQWLTLEKKFLFVIPMCMFADWKASALGTDVDAYLDSAAFVVIEANGLVGLANARKNTNAVGSGGNGMGCWNILNSEGIGNDKPSCRNNPDYGNSYRPADSRIIPFVLPFSQPAINAGIYSASISNGTINASVVYSLLGTGNVLPNIVGNNIAPVQRLGFVDQTGYVASNSFVAYPTPDTVYSARNKVLPIFAALAGVFADGTFYDSSSGGASGYNYNFSAAARHKYPLNDFLESVMIPLSKPMFRYFTDNGGRWVPRMNTEPTINGNTAYDYFQPANQGTVPDYRPNSTLRTLMSFMAGNAANATDGIMPLMTDNTNLVTKLLSLLQRLGNTAEGSPYKDTGEDTSGDNLNILADFSTGLEQVVTSFQVERGEAIVNGYTFSDTGRNDTGLATTRYGWMFANSGTSTASVTATLLTDSTKTWTADSLIGWYVVIQDGPALQITDNTATTLTFVGNTNIGASKAYRILRSGLNASGDPATPVSLDLTLTLNELIGDNTKGLSYFIDQNRSTPAGTGWIEYNRLFAAMGTMMGNSGSQYYILDSAANNGTAGIIGIMDKFLAREKSPGVPLTDATDLKALRHTLGTLMARYSGGSWVPTTAAATNSELYQIVHQYLPDILNAYNRAPSNEFHYLLPVLIAFMDVDGDGTLDPEETTGTSTSNLDYMMNLLVPADIPEDVINSTYELLSRDAMWDPTYYSAGGYPNHATIKELADICDSLADRL